METIDFSKYAGTYSVTEAAKVAKKMANDILEVEKLEAIKWAKSIHGDKFTYEVKKGTSVDLRKLKAGERICASGVKGHHIFMTEKSV